MCVCLSQSGGVVTTVHCGWSRCSSWSSVSSLCLSSSSDGVSPASLFLAVVGLQSDVVSPTGRRGRASLSSTRSLQVH